MRIQSFRIENFRNLRFAECQDVPSFMVICGGNGCGKSAILEALMTAKETAGAYGNYAFDSRAVSAGASYATIAMTLEYSQEERDFVKTAHGNDCGATEGLTIGIQPGGQAVRRDCPPQVHQLLSHYGRGQGSPGFFEYISAYRQPRKTQLSNWDTSHLTEQRVKETLASSTEKFAQTKQYLASLVMRDLQKLQKSLLYGAPEPEDSLKEIREFFNSFFTPMRFLEMHIDTSPFECAIGTPNGDIELDDLSSGEKEIFQSFVRFHQLRPKGAVILFDEADAHLHPDLERRYLDVLRGFSQESQLIVTTHSPEMMIAAGTDALYTVLKEPSAEHTSQLVRVSQSEQLHDALADLMGSRGIVSFNQRIVFIEGADASADRAIYEALYPPSMHNVSFVPAGDSATVRKTAERVNELLSASVGFQQYYSIVDHDIERLTPDPTGGDRLFKLPVYHVENFLLEDSLLLSITSRMLGANCQLQTEHDVEDTLKSLLLADSHLKPYTRALLDARIAAVAKQAYDAVYRKQTPTLSPPEFAEIEAEARSALGLAITDGTWRAKCKGRDLLKAYCGTQNLNYEHVRNLLISEMHEPPAGLAAIMLAILGS